jgi:purine-binding chemotaxis protein CheW
MSDHTSTSAASRLQFIAFRAGDQEFAADIMMIREIRGWTPATPLPHAPEHVRGVINLRGLVLPVVDLKARLGGGITDAAVKHVIIVVKSGEHSIGLLVDAVSEILTTTAADIQPPPEMGQDAQSSFVKGVAVIGDRMVTVLDMAKLTASLVGRDFTAEAA